MLSLLVAAVIATSAPNNACSWEHPGANPYRGDPAAAVADFGLPASTRSAIQAKMRAHKFDAVVTIGRERIGGVGLEAEYEDLRDMHSGHGKVCHGPVDRSKWKPLQTERGLVYCADGECIIVPTVCNNVSRVTRKPDAAPETPLVVDNSSIDISPAAGPAVPAVAQPQVAAPDSFESGSGGGYSGSPYSGGLDGGGIVFARPPKPPASTPSSPVGPIPPIIVPPIIVPPVSAVPEPEDWLLMLAGLLVIVLFVIRRSRK
jgi:hypothetical protein